MKKQVVLTAVASLLTLASVAVLPAFAQDTGGQPYTPKHTEEFSRHGKGDWRSHGSYGYGSYGRYGSYGKDMHDKDMYGKDRDTGSGRYGRDMHDKDMYGKERPTGYGRSGYGSGYGSRYGYSSGYGR